MAAAVLGVSTPSTANATTYASGAFTPATNDLLVVFAFPTGQTGTTPTCAGSAGLAFTLVKAQAKNNGDVMAIFVANALSTNASQTVSVTLNSASTGCDIVVIRVSGMTKTGATAALQTAGTNAGIAFTPNTVYTNPSNTTSVNIAGVGNQTNPGGVTVPTSFTSLANSGHSTPNGGYVVASRDSGHTSDTITWGSTSATAWGALSIELDTSSGTNASFTTTKRTWSITIKDPVIQTSAQVTSTKRTWSITVKDPVVTPRASFTTTKRTFSIAIKDPVIHTSAAFTSTKRTWSIAVKASRTVRTSASFTSTKRTFSLTVKDPVIHTSAGFTTTKRTFSLTVKDPVIHTSAAVTSTKRTFNWTPKSATVSTGSSVSASFTATKRTFSLTQKSAIVHGSTSFTSTKRTFGITIKDPVVRGSARFTTTKRTFSVTVKPATVRGSSAFVSTKRTFAITVKSPTTSGVTPVNAYAWIRTVHWGWRIIPIGRYYTQITNADPAQAGTVRRVRYRDNKHL